MKKIVLSLAIVIAIVVYGASRLITRDTPNVPAFVPDKSEEEPGPSKQPPVIKEEASQVAQAPEELPLFRVDSEEDALQMLAELGIDNEVFQQNLAKWGHKHGVSIGWMVPVEDLLDQPYHQYDDGTLKGLADNGSMWAQQILGSRWMSKRPAEALELFRLAAAQGSLQAAASLANLYRTVRSRETPDAEAVTIEQIVALNDSANSPDIMSYAWSVVEEKMWQAPVSPRVTLTQENIATACDLADSLYQDLLETRRQNGLGEFNIATPPMFIPTLLGTEGSSCYPTYSTRDLSNCKGARIKDGDDSQPIWFCVE